MEANFLARLSSSDEYDMALELYMDIYIYIYIYIYKCAQHRRTRSISNNEVG